MQFGSLGKGLLERSLVEKLEERSLVISHWSLGESESAIIGESVMKGSGIYFFLAQIIKKQEKEAIEAKLSASAWDYKVSPGVGGFPFYIIQ